jgi:enhancing lycopene biosynthesis protein 2
MAVTQFTRSRFSSEAEPEPPSSKFAPDIEKWDRVCKEAGSVYRGYIKPFVTKNGERLEAVILFNDSEGLATGLSISEFTPQNIRARFAGQYGSAKLADKKARKPVSLLNAADALATALSRFRGRP